MGMFMTRRALVKEYCCRSQNWCCLHFLTVYQGIQAKEATESAFKDGKQLLDYHLYQVPHRCCLSGEKVLVCFCSADGEGEIEMTGSMLLITELCDHFVPTKKATHTKNACGGGQDHVPHYCLHGTRSEITHGADPRLGG